jgi:hypothetical protein
MMHLAAAAAALQHADHQYCYFAHNLLCVQHNRLLALQWGLLVTHNAHGSRSSCHAMHAQHHDSS